MTAVLAIVERILGILLSLLGLTSVIQQQTQRAAQEHSDYLIEGIVTTTGIAIAHPTYGLEAIRAAIDSLAAGLADITPTPAVPPPSADDNAAAIWQYPISQQNPDGFAQEAAAAEWLYTLGHSLAIYSATEGLPDGRQPYYRLVFGGLSTAYSLGYNWSITAVARPDPPDFTQLRLADTALSFMQRIQPAYAWVGTGPSGVAGTAIAWKNVAGGPNGLWWRTSFLLPIVTPNQAAPVWPGLDNVTLGAPTALGADVTVAGPMDGMLIAVTTPPSGLGKFTVGGFTSYYSIGQISFVSDNGEAEPWQYIGFDVSLYCPRQQTRAASAILRVLAGAGGTATPWLAN